MTQIRAADYNSIRNSIANILGTGAAQQGYGQTVQSSNITPGVMITAQQWDDLRFDIVSVKVHQDGSLPNIIDVDRADLIAGGAGDPKVQYDNIKNLCVQNKFLIGQAQFEVNNRGSESRNTAWNNEVISTVSLTFNNSDQARYFFNSGGRIRFFSSRTGGPSTSQNTAWSDLLAGVGTVSFGTDTTPPVTYYGLTTAYQTIFLRTASSPYSANYYSIEVRCNVADNVNGTASSLEFRIKWADVYVDPGNSPTDVPNTDGIVSGTLILQVEELKASGALFPAGTFTIISPTYSVSPIAGS